MAVCCPICDRKTDEKYRPFCSKRCADIDLGRWFDGTYAVADEVERPSEQTDLADGRPETRH